MTGVEKFEEAIVEFGVDAALDYFGVPKELHYLWGEGSEVRKLEKEKASKKCDTAKDISRASDGVASVVLDKNYIEQLEAQLEKAKCCGICQWWMWVSSEGCYRCEGNEYENYTPAWKLCDKWEARGW